MFVVVVLLLFFRTVATASRIVVVAAFVEFEDLLLFDCFWLFADCLADGPYWPQVLEFDEPAGDGDVESNSLRC